MKINAIRKYSLILVILIANTIFTSDCINQEIPPFHGTIFIEPNIITPDDPTTFISLYYNGTAPRVMYDRRFNDWIDEEPFLFPATYENKMEIEIQVNSEFGDFKSAQMQAEKYAVAIGRLTTELRKDVKTVWIHKGMKPFGGGNNNLLIHTDWSIKHYEKQGILEETLIHEASHTSLDSQHSKNSNWIKAQKNDCTFISKYAQENPQREDIAESYLPYLAIRYRSD